jgi:hypothetical protein
MQSERRALPANEQEQFRASAVKVLKDSAFNDEPVIRMHAIEAFQDVAPREGIPCIEANIENG